ncbi:MAG: hypothetical protein P4M09_20555 [Devosia sp.]|nr:hypothetical protein [Devosia sp.]
MIEPLPMLSDTGAALKRFCRKVDGIFELPPADTAVATIVVAFATCPVGKLVELDPAAPAPAKRP